MKRLSGTVYPVMLTPYTSSMAVDYSALDELVDWYIANGCDGLFAVCQSSEMFFLTEDEREKVTAAVVKRAGGRVPVVSSGHISDALPDQIRELKRIASTGADSVVLVTNRLAAQHEDEEVVKENLQRILEALPDVDFGLYECPYPYKRLFSPRLVKWCAQTGRFTFFKETSCRMDFIQPKLEAVRGSNFRFFNANTETLLASLRSGCDGFSGVMANVHPQLYAWLLNNYKDNPEKAEKLQAYLFQAGLMVETEYYSLNAKFLLHHRGVSIQVNSRNPKVKQPSEEVKAMMMKMAEDDQKMLGYLNI